MKRIVVVVLIAIFQLGCGARAEEHGRIKKKPPTPLEVDRIASDMVMNDGSLRKGDIVSTDRGFFLYRGRGPDGFTRNDFVRALLQDDPLPGRLQTSSQVRFPNNVRVLVILSCDWRVPPRDEKSNAP